MHLQITSPIDIGISWFNLQTWETISGNLAGFGYVAYKEMDNIDLDHSIKKYYKWIHKKYDIDSFNTSNIDIKCISKINNIKVILSNHGIALLIITYDLSPDTTPKEALSAYNNLSQNHINEIYKNIYSEIVSQISYDELNIFYRKKENKYSNSPHWTHGIFLHQGTDSNLLNKEQLAEFSQSHSYYEYYHNQHHTASSFGWEMTAISTSGPLSEKGLLKLIWVIGCLWEELYIFEYLTVDKVSSLQKSRAELRLKLAEARKFRTIVSVIIASATPANITMTERYLRCLEYIMDEWRISDRKESLIGKVGLLELMYSHIKDEERESRGARFNLYVLILTVIAGIGTLAELTIFLTTGTSVSEYSRIIWVSSLFFLLVGIVLISRWHLQKYT